MRRECGALEVQAIQKSPPHGDCELQAASRNRCNIVRVNHQHHARDLRSEFNSYNICSP